MSGADDLEEALVASVERAIRAGEDDTMPDPEVDSTREIPAPEATWAFGQDAGVNTDAAEVTTEQAVAAVHALLNEFRNDGLETVGPKDFKNHLGRDGRIGRSRAWLSPLLSDLADERIHLDHTDDPGVYRLLDPELAPA